MARSRDYEMIVDEYKKALERLASENPQLTQLRNILASQELQVNQRSSNKAPLASRTKTARPKYVSVEFMEGVEH